MNYSLEEAKIGAVLEKIRSFIFPSENNNYKSKLLQSNTLLYCVILLLFLKIITTLISVNIPQNIFFADITKAVLENSVNQTRESIGLQPLLENVKLDQAAQLKAENMVQNQYFNHTSPTGITPWFWFIKAGYNYHYAGENLAVGFFDSEEVYNAWLNSPSHKANIVNPNYTEFGTAVLQGFGANNSIIVVQEFGSPIMAKTVAPKENNPNTVATQQKTNPPAQAANTNEKVLSQTTESQNSIEPATAKIASNLPSKVLNSVMYNYDELLQNIIFGVSLVVIGILLTLIFFNFNINFRKELVARAALIIILLFAATLINKDAIILLIPHQVTI